MKKYDVRRGAYYGDPAYKTAHLRAHEKADRVRQGTYGNVVNEACSVGCAITSLSMAGIGPKHLRVPWTHFVTSNGAYGEPHIQSGEGLNVPKELMQINDWIFEGLTAAEAVTWPRDFLKAIQVGADLSCSVLAVALALKPMSALDIDLDSPVFFVRTAVGQDHLYSSRLARCREARPIILDTLRRIKAPKR